MGIFYKLRSKIPASVIKSVYYAFVHSYVLYGIEVYANTCPTYLKLLHFHVAPCYILVYIVVNVICCFTKCLYSFAVFKVINYI